MATIQATTTSAFEQIKGIRIKNSSTREDFSSDFFGGKAYSASVNVSVRQPTTIQIRIIHKGGKLGKFNIDKNHLSVLKKSAKDIQISNLIFHEFFLKSYNIESNEQNSILTVEYVDKSIFLDKIFVGLLNKHWGRSLAKRTINYEIGGSKKSFEFEQIINNQNIVSGAATVQMQYACPNDGGIGSNIKNVTLTRFNLDRIRFGGNVGSSGSSGVTYKNFYTEYNYFTHGVDGGFIVVGEEMFDEIQCALPEVNYSFEDLVNALDYCQIPGLRKRNLSNDYFQQQTNFFLDADGSLSFNKQASEDVSFELYKNLRRQYFGTLRNVLQSWGADLGIEFYFQPKITVGTRDYSNIENSGPAVTFKNKIVPEGLKYINIKNPVTLDGLNNLINSEVAGTSGTAGTSGNVGNGIAYVLESVSESADLGGTFQSNLITSVRRDARNFARNGSNVTYGTANPLTVNELGAGYYTNAFLNSNEFLVLCTLAKINSQLRDIYASSLIGTSFDLDARRALGFLNFEPITGSETIIENIISYFWKDASVQNNTTLASSTFNDFFRNPNNFACAIVRYNEESKNKLTQWESSFIDSFYNKYFEINLLPPYSNCNLGVNIDYTTKPDSEIYSNRQLPYQELIANEVAKSGFRRIFSVDNPMLFSDTLLKSVITENQNIQTFSPQIIEITPDATAAALNTVVGFAKVNEYLQNGKYYVFIYPKIVESFFKINIEKGQNFGVNILAQQSSSVTSQASQKQCRDLCEENIFENICQRSSNQAIGNPYFESNHCKVISIQAFNINLTGSSGTLNIYLPSFSPYRYNIEENWNAINYFAAQKYQLGKLYDPQKANVMSIQVNEVSPPEILTQNALEIERGIRDRAILYGKDGKYEVKNISEFHKLYEQNLNLSVTQPYQKKTLSLTSTFIPDKLADYIFKAPSLTSMNFDLDESGFKITIDFESRPPEPLQENSLFETLKFIKTF